MFVVPLTTMLFLLCFLNTVFLCIFRNFCIFEL